MNRFFGMIIFFVSILLCVIGYGHLKKTVPSEVVYLYWTGGYDSTFRLCELLLIHHRPVQPIYLSSLIDNYPTGRAQRRNQSFEMESMNQIIQWIHTTQPPSISSLLFPLRIVSDSIPYSSPVSKAMNYFYSIGTLRRPICQYGALAQYALSHPSPIEICVEKDPLHSAMYKTVAHLVDSVTHQLPMPSSPEDPYWIFHPLRFSIIHRTKEEMRRIARQHHFDPVLFLTWSCWYPTETGSPCGRCMMCQDRIISG